MQLTDEGREALMKLGEESDSRTICVEDMYGHYIPVAEIKRAENCPKELFNDVMKQLINDIC